MTDFNVGDRVRAKPGVLSPHRDDGDPRECGCGGGVVGFVTRQADPRQADRCSWPRDIYVRVRVYLDTLGEFDRGEDLPYLARELEHID